ncbi:hypothetical protein HPP92_000529 [Vanilla planifolia]|uniref:Uncharacterized protein n=1 Tax=Vanilla planifolia TaxID=51239 RepID=A0A835RSA6_VANPL|nr:hypothetical protein HPP92_000529 [Vanilla planifolia]
MSTFLFSKMTTHLTLSNASSIFSITVEGRRRIADEGGGGGRHRTFRCCHRNRDRVPVLRLFSAFPQSPLRQQQQQQVRSGGDDKHDYFLNLGHAIRALREDYPVVFCKEPDFSIYRDDIVFADPLNKFGGINNYKSILLCLRVIGPMLFKALWVDVLSILQPIESTIVVRWTIHGTPRVPWESHSRFDGVSVYKLDGKGKIYEHRVDNFARNPPTRFKVMAVEELIQSLGCPSPAKPTYFETSLSSVVTNSVPFLIVGLFVGYYLVMYLTLSGHWQILSQLCK